VFACDRLKPGVMQHRHRERPVVGAEENGFGRNPKCSGKRRGSTGLYFFNPVADGARDTLPARIGEIGEPHRRPAGAMGILVSCGVASQAFVLDFRRAWTGSL
jgi:hypothetical protein